MFISTPATSFGKTQNNDYQKIYCPPILASSTTSHILCNPPSGQWQVSKHFKEATVMDR